MSLALKVYDAFKQKEEDAKAHAMAQVFDELEERFLRKDESVTKEQLNQVNYSLQLEIEKVRAEIKDTEKRLSVQIEQVRAEVLKYMNRQIIWIIGAMSVIIGALKALDYVLK